MKNSIKIFAVLLFLFNFSFCKKDKTESAITTIKVGQDSTVGIGISDLITVKQAVKLDATGNAMLRSIRKVIFDNENAYLLDNETDFQDVYSFDKTSGKFNRKIGIQGGGADEYEGLNDVAINAAGEIVMLVAGKTAFYNYSPNGGLLSKTASGIIGDRIEFTSAGNLVAYNEHSETEISGLNYLLIYDENGNLIGRHSPYNEIKEGRAYSFSGFVSKSEGRVWYSPPFCDTIFEVTATNVFPRYAFDFGESKVPDNVAQGKVSGFAVHNNSFINEYFVKTGRFLQIEFQALGRIKHGIFDEITGRFVSVDDLKNDCLTLLFLRGSIMPKEDNEFVVVLRPEQIASILNDKNFDFESLNQFHPELATLLKMANVEKNPVLIYGEFRDSAKI